MIFFYFWIISAEESNSFVVKVISWYNLSTSLSFYILLIKIVKELQLPQQETINFKKDDTKENDRFTPKKIVTVKTKTMKKIILAKKIEWLEWI